MAGTLGVTARHAAAAVVLGAGADGPVVDRLTPSILTTDAQTGVPAPVLGLDSGSQEMGTKRDSRQAKKQTARKANGVVHLNVLTFI